MFDYVAYSASNDNEHRVAYSARNFAKSSYSDLIKFRNAGLPIGKKSNGLNLFSRLKKIVEQGWGHLFIT